MPHMIKQQAPKIAIYQLPNFQPTDRAASCLAAAVSMWAVPLAVRPASQAVQVITMHAFGDVPSPPIIGRIQGASSPPSTCCQACQYVIRVSQMVKGRRTSEAFVLSVKTCLTERGALHHHQLHLHDIHTSRAGLALPSTLRMLQHDDMLHLILRKNIEVSFWSEHTYAVQGKTSYRSMNFVMMMTMMWATSFCQASLQHETSTSGNATTPKWCCEAGTAH